MPNDRCKHCLHSKHPLGCSLCRQRQKLHSKQIMLLSHGVERRQRHYRQAPWPRKTCSHEATFGGPYWKLFCLTALCLPSLGEKRPATGDVPQPRIRCQLGGTNPDVQNMRACIWGHTPGAAYCSCRPWWSISGTLNQVGRR